MSGPGGADASPGGMGGGAVGQSMPYLHDVAFADGAYIAVGEYDDPANPGPSIQSLVLRSTDGTNWKLVHHDRDEVPRSIARGKDIWLAAGTLDPENKGLLLRSEDGVSWRRLEAPPSAGLNQVVWTGSRFLLAGYDDQFGTHLFDSDDGTSWTVRENLSSLHLFTRGSSALLAVGPWEDFFLSRDGGLTFASVTVQSDNGAEAYPAHPSIEGLWADGDGFQGLSLDRCCYGEQPSSDRYFALASADGMSWTYERTTSIYPRTAVVKEGTWVGIWGRIFTKTQTTDWTPEGAMAGGNALAVAVGDRFVVVGSGQEAIVSSVDGVSWTVAGAVEYPAP